jgi:hypothetical protein
MPVFRLFSGQKWDKMYQICAPLSRHGRTNAHGKNSSLNSLAFSFMLLLLSDFLHEKTATPFGLRLKSKIILQLLQIHLRGTDNLHQFHQLPDTGIVLFQDIRKLFL